MTQIRKYTNTSYTSRCGRQLIAYISLDHLPCLVLILDTDIRANCMAHVMVAILLSKQPVRFMKTLHVPQLTFQIRTSAYPFT